MHDMVAHECEAVRTRVGLMDISAFAKIEVSGPGAEPLLDYLCANRLPQKTGGIALTHMLNRRGRIELELTVVKLAPARFYLVCAAFFEQRLLDHLAAYMSDGSPTEIRHLSDSHSALSLNGPHARDVLSRCTGARLENAAFPWLTAQEIIVAGHPVWALRLSYAGELGWELHIPRENALAVYDALWQAGQAFDIANYGSFAMNVLRLEKAFKGAGELTNEVTLPEADVMRFVRPEKNFLGAEATRKSSQSNALPWICTYLEIEPDGIADGHGGEAVLLNGQTVGATSSIAFSPTVHKNLAFAYLEPHAATPGTTLEVIIQGIPRPARVLAEPAYDAQNTRPRTDAP